MHNKLQRNVVVISICKSSFFLIKWVQNKRQTSSTYEKICFIKPFIIVLVQIQVMTFHDFIS